MSAIELDVPLTFDRPLAIVPDADPAPASATEVGAWHSVPEAGLARAILLGGLAGFLVVFVLTAAGLALFTSYGLLPSLGAGAFTAAFAGIGFGAMVTASVHH
jgi:hypothetical protein